MQQPPPPPSAPSLAATAPLPRQLNVQQFAAARDPELQGLWASLEGLGRLAADQLLLRHLRRRATSHRRYLCRRRPNTALAKQAAAVHSNDAAAAGTGATNASNGVSRRPLNRAQRRRPALLQQAAVDGSSSRGSDSAAAAAAAGSSSPPGAGAGPAPTRLETHVWHARRMRMTCCWGHVLALGAFGRGRGSRSLLHEALRLPGPSKPTSRFRTPAAAGGADARSSTAASAAAGGSGRHGPIRAVVHDASYWQCLQLQGQQQQLAQLLEAMTDPQLLQARVLQHAGVLGGAAEVQVVLHHAGSFPAGAIGPVKLVWHPPAARKHQQQQQQQGMEVDSAVRPAPDQQQQGGRRQRRQQLQQQQERVLWLWAHAAYAAEAQAALQAGIEQQQQEHVRPVAVTRVSLRRLELTGPSADVVMRAVIMQQRQQHGARQQQQQQQPVQQPHQQPQPAAPGGTSPSHNAVWEALTAAPLSRWSLVPDGAVLGLAAVDPRLAKPCRHAGLCDLPPQLRAPGASAAMEAEGASSIDAAASAAATAALTQLRQHWPANGRRWWGPGRPLMSDPAAGSAAAAEVAISTWRQQQQAAALLGPGIGLPGWLQQQQQQVSAGQHGSRSRAVPLRCALDADRVSAYGITSRIGESSSTQQQQQQQQQEQQQQENREQQQAEAGSDEEDVIMFDAGPETAGNSTAAATAASDAQAAKPTTPPPPPSAAAAATVTAVLPSGCRVLLVRQAGRTAATAAPPGWSLLLPPGWVMPFWQALTHAGAKPAGLREWAWIAAATQQHLPPLDYPDTAAAAASAAALHAEALAAAGMRPLGRWAWHSSRSTSSQAPSVDWRLLGRQMLLPTGDTSKPAISASGVQQQQPEGDSMPSVQQCWAAAQLQAPAAAVKRHRQRHRGRVKQLERARQQQQQRQPEAPDPAPAPAARKQLSSQKALRARVRAKLLEQQQQQLSQALLLPPGSYVARSWRVLLAALPTTAAPTAGDTRQPAASAGVVGVPASVLAAGRSPNRRLAAALQQGRLAWAPVTPSCSSSSLLLGQAAPAAAAAAAGDGGAAAMEVDATAAEAGEPTGVQQDTASSSSAQCLVRVSVRVLGKGRSRAGAAILAGGCSTGATAATLLGYVTAAVPRGASAELYPGGLGFCSGPALWRLRAQDVRPASARVLRAWLLNPGSSVLRRVQLSVAFEGDE